MVLGETGVLHKATLPPAHQALLTAAGGSRDSQGMQVLCGAWSIEGGVHCLSSLTLLSEID